MISPWLWYDRVSAKLCFIVKLNTASLSGAERGAVPTKSRGAGDVKPSEYLIFEMKVRI